MTEPVEHRTIYLTRVPRTVSASMILVAVAVVIMALGFLGYQRHAQGENTDLRRQLADSRTQQTCRASYNNQVSLAIADQNIASGAVNASLADFVIAVLARDRTATTRIQATLAEERKQLAVADVALHDAVEQQRLALANC